MASLISLINKYGGLIQTGPFGSQLKQSEYSDDGVPVVMPKDIYDGKIDSTLVARVPENKAQTLSRHYLKSGTILFPRRGDIAKCALITEHEEGYLCGTGCIKIEPPKGHIDPTFLYYFLTQPKITEWLERNAIGSTMLNLNTQIIGRIDIPDIRFKAQLEISNVLKNYDDLIENNRRRIQLLEESARLLYKEWFVHLRFPGHEHVKIVDGVPEGWSPTLLPEVIDVNPKTPAEKNKEILYVPMSALSETSMVANTLDFELQPLSTSVKFIKNDVLLARITPCLENGKTGFAYFLQDGEVACGSTEFIVLRNKKLSPGFIYCLARSYPFRENAIKSMTGSSGRQRVQTSCFDKYKVPLPPRHLMTAFNDVVDKNFEQIRVLMQQNDRLIKARDLLLPRLMNGELTL